MTAKPLPYTPAVKAGDLLFVSGQVGLDNGELVDGGLEPQMKQAFANLTAVLTEHGASVTDIVKTSVFITNMDDFGPMNELYAEFFGSHLPARSTIAAVALPRGATFEIDAVAHVK